LRSTANAGAAATASSANTIPATTNRPKTLMHSPQTHADKPSVADHIG
jgi:hypothetical protein